ncbi:PAS domain-containing protein [Natrinema pallidum]|uniref:histidine kinase n=1 Tax=Natrinema pallidum DSM 3751 TaxID=1227495 RepID=L9YQ60_9EURY|nr:PAS sensor protein [Natrinema pallidum DSM 3751]
MSTRADADDETFWEDADDVALHRYRTLVNAIDDGLYQLDADGRFVAVNDVIVETTGYTRDDLLGERVSLVLADADVRRTKRELESVLESVVADLRLRIEEANTDIEIADLPRVEGDASQLRQVFQNLLSNAIEYTDGAPPRISVDAERRGSEWLISVHDEGIGIESDDQDRVFEVFQCLHSRENYSGIGIGLALCQRIIERHGGEIRVDSEPGVGSTFSLTLPAVATDSR